MITPAVSQPISALITLGLGALFSALLLPITMRVAVALDIVDKPGGRRRHLTPVPRIGGVAVIIASACAGGLALLLGVGSLTTSGSPHLRGAVMGAVIVFSLGVADDVAGVAPWVKLLAQCAAALVVVNSGLSVDALTAAKGLRVFEMGMWGPALTVLWIVGVTNAFNLIDGIDGLATMSAVVAIVTLMLSEQYLHQGHSLLFVAALLGALLAFARMNRYPARVFLGDSGSMTIGFLLSVRALSSATDVSGSTYAFVPLVALAYPLLDTFVAMARRWLRAHPLSRADGRHIHHQLLVVGLTVRQAVWLIGAGSAMVALLGLSISFAPPQFTLALALAAVIMMTATALYGISWLGYGEFAALGKSMYFGIIKARRVVRERIRAVDVAQRIKTASTEHELRECLLELVDHEHVYDIELVDTCRDAGSSLGGNLDARLLSRLILVECPLSGSSVARGRMRLRVLTSESGVFHHSTERIVHIIGAGLGHWYSRLDNAPLAPRFKERRRASPSMPVAVERRRSAISSAAHVSSPVGAVSRVGELRQATTRSESHA